jgi:CTP:molybdopterin cytidylyltransferase MocA
MSYAAVITAGGRVDGEFARTIGTQVKALAPIRGTTLLAAAITALRENGVNRIAVVGGAEVRRSCASSVERVIEESADGAENVRRALQAWNGVGSLLYLTSDMPYITGAALRGFIESVPQGTLALPLTEWDAFERRFPGAPPFGVTLSAEKVVNGGAFVIPGAACARVERLATTFFDARKSVWRMARLAGPALLVRFAMRRLTIAALETRGRKLLEVPALGVRGAPPELAYDVDTVEEYRYAAAHA